MGICTSSKNCGTLNCHQRLITGRPGLQCIVCLPVQEQMSPWDGPALRLDRAVRRGHSDLRRARQEFVMSNEKHSDCTTFGLKVGSSVKEAYTRPKNKQQFSCLRILTDNGPCSAAPGFESLESRMLKYSADEYLFRAALCHLCVDWWGRYPLSSKYSLNAPASVPDLNFLESFESLLIIDPMNVLHQDVEYKCFQVCWISTNVSLLLYRILLVRTWYFICPVYET
jgi:hypothetical protein